MQSPSDQREFYSEYELHEEAGYSDGGAVTDLTRDYNPTACSQNRYHPISNQGKHQNAVINVEALDEFIEVHRALARLHPRQINPAGEQSYPIHRADQYRPYPLWPFDIY